MFTLLLLLLTIITCLTALVRPWIGVCAYYVMALLSPQTIWPWIFGDLRVSMLVSASTLGGFILMALGRRIDLGRLRNVQTYALVGLWVLAHLSHIFSPYADYARADRMFSPTFILDLFNTMVLLYLIAVLVIDSERKLKYLLLTLVGTALYFTYWANRMYLTGEIWQHQVNGRLSGPGSIYADTNSFALLFVVAMPFLFYLGHYAQHRLIKYGLWAVIPLLWHAAFLTGSRGGLLAMGVASLFIAWRYRSRHISIALVLALVVAVIDQGGTVLNRTEGTVAQQQSGAASEPLDPRLQSWVVSLQIIPDHPWLGVGTGRFQQASPEYGYDKGLVEHNTFLQFTVGSGLPAGLCYLLLFLHSWRRHRIERQPIGRSVDTSFIGITREATSTALLAFGVGSIFLNLMLFEAFYFLLAISLITTHLYREKTAPGTQETRRPRRRERLAGPRMEKST